MDATLPSFVPEEKELPGKTVNLTPKRLVILDEHGSRQRSIESSCEECGFFVDDASMDLRVTIDRIPMRRMLFTVNGALPPKEAGTVYVVSYLIGLALLAHGIRRSDFVVPLYGKETETEVRCKALGYIA